MLKFQKRQQWQQNRPGGLFTEFVARCLGRQLEGRLAAGAFTGSTWDTDCQEYPTPTAVPLSSCLQHSHEGLPGCPSLYPGGPGLLCPLSKMGTWGSG